MIRVSAVILALVTASGAGLALGWALGVRGERRRIEARRGGPERRGDWRPLPFAPVLSSPLVEPRAPRAERPELTRSGVYASPVDSIGSSSGDGESVSTGEFTAPGLIARIEPQAWRWRTATPELQALLGLGASRLSSSTFLDSIDPVDRAGVIAGFQRAMESGEAHGLVCRLVAPAGSRVVEIDVAARYAPDGRVAYLRCHLTDLTDRLAARRERRRRARELRRVNDALRRANRALAALKNRYSDLYQNSPAMYFSLDPEGRIVACNDTLVRTVGRQRGELLGRPYAELLAPEARAGYEERFARFLREGEIEAESRWRTADGRVLDVLVKGTAVLDPEGRLLRSRSVAQDITTLKRLEAELRRNNERLARANAELSARNRELDEFAYVVSHDLQEPVRTLVAFADFLREDCAGQLDERGREYVRHLAEAARRMRALIRDLLELSRAGQTVAGFERVSLEAVVEEVRADLSELIRSRRAELVVEGNLPEVLGDRRRIGQMLANLVGNGLKYNRAEHPRVVVGAGPGARPGTVVVRVRDNGIGIAAEHHEKIFHLFRRLHARDEFEGTGAGLAICQKIAEAHGGRIWVESQVGAGSTFLVELPLPETGPGRGAVERAQGDGAGPHGDIGRTRHPSG